MSLFAILITIIFILLGMPLFLGLGLLSLLLFYVNDGIDSVITIFLDPFGRLSQNDLMLPIIYFGIMGYILAGSQMPRRIVTIFQYILQKTIGNKLYTFGMVSILVSAFFTPLTGASGVTIIALGGILYSVMKRAGYDHKENIGIITSSGSLGLLFFPSIPVILYGIVSNNKVSIQDLFIAGLIPGLVFITLPLLYTGIKYYRSNHSVQEVEKLRFREIRSDFFKLLLELAIMPLLFYLFLTGSITISEIGLIAMIYYLILETGFFRDLTISAFKNQFIEAITILGGIIVIIFFAVSFTSFLIDHQIPMQLFNLMENHIKSKMAFLILLNLFLLLVGSLMDIFSAIIVVAPLVIPVAELYQINMVHLGILFLTNLEIGYITPPVGINLFLSSFRFKLPLIEIYNSVLPYLLLMLFAQLLITYIPYLSLFLLN